MRLDAKSGSTCERSEVERRMSEEPAWPAPCLTSSVPLVAGPFVRGLSASLSPPSTAGQNTQQRHSQLHHKRTLFTILTAFICQPNHTKQKHAWQLQTGELNRLGCILGKPKLKAVLTKPKGEGGPGKLKPNVHTPGERVCIT